MIEQKFLKFVKKERDNFCRFITTINWNVKLRTKSENLLIVYDQMHDMLEKQMKLEQSSTYVLFGQQACYEHHSDGELTTDEGCVTEFKYGAHIDEILEVASGWNDYAVLTEQEYMKYLQHFHKSDTGGI